MLFGPLLGIMAVLIFGFMSINEKLSRIADALEKIKGGNHG